MISSLRPEIYTGEETPASLESSTVPILCGLGILVGDAAIEKGSLIMMNMIKFQSGKGQVVTLKQSDINGCGFTRRHLGLIRIH